LLYTTGKARLNIEYCILYKILDSEVEIFVKIFKGGASGMMMKFTKTYTRQWFLIPIKKIMATIPRFIWAQASIAPLL